VIVGGPGDAHAAAVGERLVARGVAVTYLDFAAFPAEVTLAWDPIARTGVLVCDGREQALERLRAVYWRLATRPRAPAGLQAGAHGFAEDESRRAIEATLRALPCPVINTPEAVAAHRFKPLQSAAVAALGVATPATLISNSPAALRAFVATQPAGVIVKPVGGGAYARRLVAADLERGPSIRACPMQYQAYVPGEDLRIYVVDERVFAGRIVTRDRDHVDFRTDPDHHSVACALGPDDVARCLRIARTLGLRFTGIDLRRTDAGELVFLEANPSPMFLRFEHDTGHPITQALVDALLHQAPVAPAPLDARAQASLS
jgi:hypothetical protein